jgi:uncharacterized protein YceH (UPF0502 family)
MSMTILTEAQARVIGSMIEKQLTTPMNYPMTPNAIRVACNQKSNRDPVVDYSDDEIYDRLQELQRLGCAEIDAADYGRTSKYRQTFGKLHDLERGELVILCELFIRGPQTPGELRSRCERMHRFKDLTEVERCLGQLVGKKFVLMLERQPGTKEHRWAHLFCGAPRVAAAPAPASPAVPAAGMAPAAAAGGLEARLGELERHMRLMEERLAALEGRRQD